MLLKWNTKSDLVNQDTLIADGLKIVIGIQENLESSLGQSLRGILFIGSRSLSNRPQVGDLDMS
jgi:hypothetical protein